MGRWYLAGIALGAMMAAAPAAPAGGFDAPILFTARHTGMGGAAVGYVDDASAVFHNPAGLLGIRAVQVLGNVTVVVGSLQGSPDHDDQNASTGPLWAPAPLLAAGARVHPRVAVGFGLYPVAAGGASYRYANRAGVDTSDRAQVVFVEASPAVSVAVSRSVSVGAGYRISWVRFARHKGPPGDPGLVDFALTGSDWRGLRLGAKWRPSAHWQLGAVYRHTVEVGVRGDEGRAFFRPLRDPHARVRLPAKLAVGARADYGRASVAVDVEYGLQSQIGDIDIAATFADDGAAVSVPLQLHWRDAIIAHVGGEYRLGRALAARAGYAYDGGVTNPAYPSAFGTPPAANHSFTGGVGYRAGRWQLNAALAYRFGAADVAPDDLAGVEACPLCAHAGRYAASMAGLWIDFSVDLEP